MLRPRFVKVMRDLTSDYTRSGLLVLAIGIGVFGVGSILGGYAVLVREMARNYLGTAPASMTIKVEDAALDKGIVREVEGLPGVLHAERHATVTARMRVGEDWYPLLLFVIDDFDAMKTNKFRRITGAWPPPEGTMLVERTALDVMKARVGGSIVVKTPNGREQPVAISGIVHDPGLAPARQEQRGYGYCTLPTLRRLGEAQGFDEVRVIAAGKDATQRAIDEEGSTIARLLEDRGYRVHEIQVPPPGRHPHQGQMNAVLLLFLVFAFLTLVLSAILVSASLATLMTRQVREIGICKAIGAGSAQVSALYLLMLLVVCGVAVLLAAPLSRLAAGLLVGQIGALLNLDIKDGSVPWWVFLVVVAGGTLVPLAVAAYPVLRGGRISALEALNSYGVSVAAFGKGRMQATLGRLRVPGSILTLSLRNVFRSRSRLAMTLLLLAAGGALFMTALNTSKAWNVNLEKIYKNRHYDLEVRLTKPFPSEKLIPSLRRIEGVREVEAWGQSPAAFRKGGAYDVVRTYPDKGHGAFLVLALPPSTKLVSLPLTRGQWLGPDDIDEVVLNQMALAQEPGLKVGDHLALSVDGRPSSWRIAGFVEDIGSPAVAYVPYAAYARLTHTEGMTDTIRISLRMREKAAAMLKTREIEGAIGASGASVISTIPVSLLRNAIAEHMAVLVGALLAMALLMAVVGTCGLMSTMSMNLIERTRELGVMRAIGATPAAVRRLVVFEGLISAAFSLVFAFALSVPLSAYLGRLIGTMAFRTPLPLVLAPAAFLAWTGLIMAGAIVASAYPAMRANKLTVRDALAYY